MSRHRRFDPPFPKTYDSTFPKRDGSASQLPEIRSCYFRGVEVLWDTDEDSDAEEGVVMLRCRLKLYLANDGRAEQVHTAWSHSCSARVLDDKHRHSMLAPLLEEVKTLLSDAGCSDADISSAVRHASDAAEAGL